MGFFFQAAPVKVQKLSFAQGKTTELDLNLAINLVQVQRWSFALEKTPDFELNLV